MEVGVRRLRDELRHWLEVAQSGDGVVVTDRGKPIARLTRVSSQESLERLISAGVVTRAEKPRRADREHRRVKSKGPVSDLVSEQRR